MSTLDADLETFEGLRPQLVALAYRMLGDLARAHDIVQDAWLRWSQRDAVVESPRAFLVTIVTRLCLNHLDSAAARREERRGDRLPEPVDLRSEASGMARLEASEQVSMAFMVLVEQLTPAERAVLLLHDVFDFTHEELAALVRKTPAACRKLLERARQRVAAGRALITTSRDEHARLLHAFVQAAGGGDVASLAQLLADDVVLVTDGGAGGRRFGRARNLTGPLVGAERVAAFVAVASKQAPLGVELRELNGQPAAVFMEAGMPVAALLLGVAGGRVVRVFFCADPARLGFVGGPSAA